MIKANYKEQLLTRTLDATDLLLINLIICMRITTMLHDTLTSRAAS
jgi:hypothetical protein